jgi:hypothetical protein
MFGNKDHRAANRDSFVGSAYWLANALAAIATIMIMPLLWGWAGRYVEGYLYGVYGDDGGAFAYLLVWGGSWAAVFFSLRMTFVTAFVAAAIAGAVRFV